MEIEIEGMKRVDFDGFGRELVTLAQMGAGLVDGDVFIELDDQGEDLGGHSPARGLRPSEIAPCRRIEWRVGNRRHRRVVVHFEPRTVPRCDFAHSGSFGEAVDDATPEAILIAAEEVDGDLDGVIEPADRGDGLFADSPDLVLLANGGESRAWPSVVVALQLSEPPPVLDKSRSTASAA